MGIKFNNDNSGSESSDSLLFISWQAMDLPVDCQLRRSQELVCLPRKDEKGYEFINNHKNPQIKYGFFTIIYFIKKSITIEKKME